MDLEKLETDESVIYKETKEHIKKGKIQDLLFPRTEQTGKYIEQWLLTLWSFYETLAYKNWKNIK